jgi:hypothetical protein
LREVGAQNVFLLCVSDCIEDSPFVVCLLHRTGGAGGVKAGAKRSAVQMG